MLMTPHFHFSIGCLIVSKAQSESEMPSVTDSITTTAASQEQRTAAKGQGREPPLATARSWAGLGQSPDHAGSSPRAVTVGALTQTECYLYQFVHLISFFAVFSEM